MVKVSEILTQKLTEVPALAMLAIGFAFVKAASMGIDVPRLAAKAFEDLLPGL